MIHSLMKEYGLNRQTAELMTEYDYCLMIGFKNLEVKKEEYLIEKNK
jgi:molybdopterin-guanine dinucleotide biosynthesis protein